MYKKIFLGVVALIFLILLLFLFPKPPSQTFIQFCEEWALRNCSNEVNKIELCEETAKKLNINVNCENLKEACFIILNTTSYKFRPEELEYESIADDFRKRCLS